MSSRHWLRQLLLTITIFTSLTNVIPSEQDRRNDSLNLYKLPSQVISGQDLDNLNGLAPVPKQDAITGLLQKYYVQFIDHKRIWQDRADGPEFNIRMEYNAIRLLTAKKKDTMAETGLIRDSPILYSLYSELGNLYESQNNDDKAVSSYLAALAYTETGATEELFTSESRLQEIFQQDEIAAARNHKKLQQDLLNARQNLKNARGRIFDLESQYSRNKIPAADYNTNMQNTKSEIAVQTERVKTLEDGLKQNKEGAYAKWAAAKNTAISELLFRLASNIRKVEDKNKERLKTGDKSVYGKGIYILYDYKKNTGFPGYLGFLEQAYRIKPDNSKAIFAIAREFQSTGKNNDSIDYYKKFIQLKDGAGETDDDLKIACFNTARLYAAEKKYSLAAGFYDRTLGLTPEKEKHELYYEMAEFQENHTGNLAGAFENYSKWLTEKNPPSLNESLKEFNARLGIASWWKFKKRQKQEEESLREAYRVYSELNKRKETLENQIADLKKELIAYKGNLLEQTDTDRLARFRMVEKSLEDKKQEHGTVVAVYNAMNKTRLLIRLAAISEIKKNPDGATGYYREIITIGNEHEIEISLRNIERLERMKRSGINESPGTPY